MNVLNNIIKIVGVIFSLSYPFIVFVALQKHISLRFMALFLVVIIVANFFKTGKKSFLFCGLLLATSLYISNNNLFLKVYPVMMNLLVCMGFLLSLKTEPLITTFAKRMKKNLSECELLYTKKLTVIWGVFMAMNVLVSFITVFLSDDIWVMYNGFVSYILMFILFVGEFFVRRRLFKC